MIDNHSITQSPGNSRQRADALSTANNGATKSSDTKEASTTNKDSVLLSSQAQTLAKLENTIKSSTGVDQEKVASIKAAIDDGSFNIDPSSIADKLLAE